MRLQRQELNQQVKMKQNRNKETGFTKVQSCQVGYIVQQISQISLRQLT